MSRWTGDFLESIGRRFVLAILLVVFTLLLALALPRSGPVRHQPAEDALWPQSDLTALQMYPVSWTESAILPVASAGGADDAR